MVKRIHNIHKAHEISLHRQQQAVQEWKSHIHSNNSLSTTYKSATRYAPYDKAVATQSPDHAKTVYVYIFNQIAHVLLKDNQYCFYSGGSFLIAKELGLSFIQVHNALGFLNRHHIFVIRVTEKNLGNGRIATRQVSFGKAMTADLQDITNGSKPRESYAQTTIDLSSKQKPAVKPSKKHRSPLAIARQVRADNRERDNKKKLTHYNVPQQIRNLSNVPVTDKIVASYLIDKMKDTGCTDMTNTEVAKSLGFQTAYMSTVISHLATNDHILAYNRYKGKRYLSLGPVGTKMFPSIPKPNVRREARSQRPVSDTSPADQSSRDHDDPINVGAFKPMPAKKPKEPDYFITVLTHSKVHQINFGGLKIKEILNGYPYVRFYQNTEDPTIIAFAPYKSKPDNTVCKLDPRIKSVRSGLVMKNITDNYKAIFGQEPEHDLRITGSLIKGGSSSLLAFRIRHARPVK